MDGIKKNIEVVKTELFNWWIQMQNNTHRFKYAGVINKGTRAPTGETNNNVFHLLTNYVSETYRALPRTLTYITILLISIYLLKIIGGQ